MFCSWAAEEPGVIGSTEFAEQFSAILKDRAVAYLNVDMVMEGKGRNMQKHHHFVPYYKIFLDKYCKLLFGIAAFVFDMYLYFLWLIVRWLGKRTKYVRIYFYVNRLQKSHEFYVSLLASLPKVALKGKKRSRRTFTWEYSRFCRMEKILLA